MASETTSYASSSSQSVVTPKELLLVLSILNEKQKLKHKQQKEKEMQQQQQYQHLHYHHQHHEQQEHKQQQLQESKWKGELEESQQLMELSQIELIYRAEGNANLVLALPQFKKVLRLPKIYKQHEQKQLEQEPQYQETQCNQGLSQQHQHAQEQQKQQDEMNQQEPNKISTTGQQQNKNDAVGILTMDHYVAYISIIRCLVGNEFVFEADIVAVPNPIDRHWINEHIKPYRPANRLDKEFGGHFGLLLPDATQLPAEFDILYSNLQRKKQPATETTDMKTSQCSNSISIDNSGNISNNIFGPDTFAIEIKPKQGWLLPNDVNNLFDIKPKIIQTIRAAQPPSLSETKTTSKAAVATTVPIAAQAKAIKSSTDSGCFTTTQTEPSRTIMAATTTPVTSQPAEAMTSRCCNNSTSGTTRDDKISHSLYDMVDTRCRYCCMQFLKIKQQKICKRNQYCPIDLFSGNTEQMFFALQSLFECPQNNLRIFKNGNIVFDDQISRTSKIDDLFSSDKLQLIKHLLVTCLLREYEGKVEAKFGEKKQTNKETKQEQIHASTASVAAVKEGEAEGDEYGAAICAGVVDGQPQSSVTSCKKQKLNTMPKTTVAASTTTLTETEVTKVKSTLTSAKPIFTMDTTSTSSSDYSTRCLEQINKAEVTCLPKNCVLQKILHLQSLAKINLQFMLDHEYADKKGKTYNIIYKLLEKFAKNHNELILCQLSPEEQYILGATALDCSIMITFCEIENVEVVKEEEPKESLIDITHVVSIFGKTFLTKVTLLDLDPKPDTHFNKYCSQTKQIIDAMNDM
ncbi:inositol-pentakisphosphate 2-kinase [Lucilia sericata]|uniref:inositol-pentakisphosphate 2-kinase n=1 Tax=Lucilia sericata TaxID=13632 RepID=UPI0018A8195A|nr:inositol-pentakisphosphate 2-kinase [Lucilia sericata]XP_037805376.1 inositol-pentakisphosphate 2-kinase [Lucilia sericata]XP_037805377.1 inositol-pentakisphosphate 2-kinase [Lucilia sericata]XP_037805378.1 inositol-pentakisphosphate 2-kinase [Lucilia sericata]XP_037805379.1 inositol-pentakisphosphate 2-kinase [Lucilia sericata]XP_037805380.1 inositol-pentakisphosphate 2-kinase [Lucilia sericata]XP_037805381.1 inositol-pentakisphosphate 2-kinase [Lucilia sericata]